jgi:hypothetical protein
MGVSEVAPRGKKEFRIVSISTSRMELGEAMSSIGVTAHEGAKGNRFRGNAGEDIKGMSRDNVREVRDYGNAVPGIRSLMRGSVNGWSGMKKGRGRVRT